MPPLSQLSATKAEPMRSSSWPVLIKSFLTTCILVGIIVTGASFYSNIGFSLLPQPTDNMTEEQRQERLNAFNALGTIHLTVVQEQDLPQALESMRLPEDARKSLQTELARIPVMLPAKTEQEVVAAPPISSQPSAETISKSTQLAWITLWDSDVEDGDAVKIDSQGYSRTVLLRKQPLTFAVPIPANGIINVTGIRDGDGGGITVGLASGDVKAIFPIMSVGQVLGLKVRIN